MISAGIANIHVVCDSIEYLHVNHPSNKTSLQYISLAGGYLLDENATKEGNSCSVKDTNTLLRGLHSDNSDQWKNSGLTWVFVVFNIFSAVCIKGAEG
jgi:ABC-type multidrug transport system permease subunit